MAYTPTVWQKGDTISTARLNKLEQGIAEGAGAFIINLSYDSIQDSITMDKTYGEIKTAILAGKSIVVIESEEIDTSNIPN